jgi:HEAT repeat protein
LRPPHAREFVGALSTVKIPAGERVGSVIDKLLPLLGDPIIDVRAAAVSALERLPAGDRAGNVIDKLLPLLEDPYSAVRMAAVNAVERLPADDRADSVIDKLLLLRGLRRMLSVRSSNLIALATSLTGSSSCSRRTLAIP